jgi:hypothetical protein
MGVDRTSLVVTGEDGLEGSYSVGIRDLDTTQESRVPPDFVTGSHDAGVVAGGVAVPDVDIDFLDGETGGDV